VVHDSGTDKDFDGKVTIHPGFRLGYLEQEPRLDPNKNVFDNVMEGVREKKALVDEFDRLSEEMAAPDADIDKLLARQAEVQNQIDAADCWDLKSKIDAALNALRCPPGESGVTQLSGVRLPLHRWLYACIV
jgi:energy-dependent translational throttle protein EttA